MISNSNIYGSYYSSLLTGVNIIADSPKSSAARKGPYGTLAVYGRVNIESANSLYAMKTGANELRSILDRLASPSLFAGRTAVSSNPGAVEVSGQGGNVKEIKITVGQTAAGQLNEGSELDSSLRVVSGTNEFQIESNGLTQLISVYVHPGDNNKTLQNKMAQAINERGIGVKASVKEKGGRSALTLESESTGDGVTFALRDITGDAVARTGVNTPTRPARNAIFTVNGEEYDKETNEVDLNGGIKVRIKEAAADPVSISMRTDADEAVRTIGELADSINDLLQNSESAGMLKIYRDISNVGKSYSGSLELLGIKQDNRGYMSIDKEKLEAAKADGSLEGIMRDFNATSYGYAQGVSRITKSASRNPAGYAVNSTFNQFLGAGMYFNMVV